MRLLAPAVFAAAAHAFYFPGVAPTSYHDGDAVPLHVNHLTPAGSQQDPKVRSVFAFDYYHPPFHFCQPDGGSTYIRESLGSILFGDRIQTSPFDLRMKQNSTCRAVCGAVTFPSMDAPFVNTRILQGYNMNWLVDGLPAAQLLRDTLSDTPFYSPGFELGRVTDDNKPVFHNHYNILVDYHQASENNFRVVGVLVQPESMADNKAIDAEHAECPSQGPPVVLSETGDTLVTFTYSVYWVPSNTPFATRWDKYLHVYDPKIHWFSLVNSAIIVFFLIGMVSSILVRTLRKDIARYNRLDQLALDDFGESSVDDGVQEDSGWKLVHGDVFRPPKNPLFLSVMLGNGAQLFMMCGLTIGMRTSTTSRPFPLLIP